MKRIDELTETIALATYLPFLTICIAVSNVLFKVVSRVLRNSLQFQLSFAAFQFLLQSENCYRLSKKVSSGFQSQEKSLKAFIEILLHNLTTDLKSI